MSEIIEKLLESSEMKNQVLTLHVIEDKIQERKNGIERLGKDCAPAYEAYLNVDKEQLDKERKELEAEIAKTLIPSIAELLLSKWRGR